MLKTIHTDFRNNKIKMIKQQFNGVSYSTWNIYISNLNCHAHINCSQAWMRDEDDDAGACCHMMQET
jgi:hypothetical protein